MPTVTVNLADTFDEWRTKTNTIGTNTGDLSSLNTTDKSSIVAAINEVITNDSDDLENIVEDTTPQLGGDLDLNGNNITGSGDVDTIGNITVTGTITSFGGFVGAINVDSDTTPSLGGDLDLNNNNIIGSGDINITGAITVVGDINLQSNIIKVGPSGTDTTITTNGSGSLTVAPNGGGSTQPAILLDNVGDITLTPPSGREVKIIGDITGTTQSPNDNSTKLATTAYVDAQVNTENTIEEMNDTIITTPTNGQHLVYNSTSSKWENTTPTVTGATEEFAVAVAIALG